MPINYETMFVQVAADALGLIATEHEEHGEWRGECEHRCTDGGISTDIRGVGENVYCERCGTGYCRICDAGEIAAVALKGGVPITISALSYR